MSRQMILPLSASFSTTFAPTANAVGILLNYPDAYPWLMNCFIQLTCWGDSYMDYYDFNYRDCPVLFCQRIKKEMIDAMGENLIAFIVKALEKHYYVMLPVETKYIKEYDFEYIHELMIYGHTDSDSFYIADNLKNGEYRKGICSAEELIQATAQIQLPENWRNGFDGTIELLSYREQGRAKFELYRVVDSIQDYLSSTATKAWYVHHAMWDADENRMRAFGIQCYNAVFSHIQKAGGQGYFENSGHRTLFLEWEHKKIMGLRLRWMKAEYPIPEDIISGCRELEEKSRIALHLKLKYDLIQKDVLLGRMETLYQSIRENEREILTGLFDSLKMLLPA